MAIDFIVKDVLHKGYKIRILAYFIPGRMLRIRHLKPKNSGIKRGTFAAMRLG
jgi:hypothetical protein